jgi:hypothetical protein
LVPSHYTKGADIVWVAAFYVFAKTFESVDRWILGLGHVVSGHTLKHLAAGAAGYWIVGMLQTREATPSDAKQA